MIYFHIEHSLSNILKGPSYKQPFHLKLLLATVYDYKVSLDFLYHIHMVEKNVSQKSKKFLVEGSRRNIRRCL